MEHEGKQGVCGTPLLSAGDVPERSTSRVNSTEQKKKNKEVPRPKKKRRQSYKLLVESLLAESAEIIAKHKRLNAERNESDTKSSDLIGDDATESCPKKVSYSKYFGTHPQSSKE